MGRDEGVGEEASSAVLDVVAFLVREQLVEELHTRGNKRQ